MVRYFAVTEILYTFHRLCKQANEDLSDFDTKLVCFLKKKKKQLLSLRLFHIGKSRVFSRFSV